MLFCSSSRTGFAFCLLRGALRRYAPFVVILALGLSVLPRTFAQDAHPTAHHVRHTVKKHHSRRIAHHSRVSSRPSAHELAHERQLHAAYIASSSLRPLAIALMQRRTPATYADVTTWARAHHGEAAALAYLALGNAYLTDGKDNQAVAALHRAIHDHFPLNDFATYFLAKAEIGAAMYPQAEVGLRHFAKKYPDSILTPFVPALLANAYLSDHNPAEALHVLRAAASAPIGSHSDYLLAYAKTELALGHRDTALTYFRRVFTSYPVTAAGAAAHDQISSMNLLHTLPPDDLRANANALFDAGRYREAKDEYLLLGRNPDLDETIRNASFVAAAACDLHLHRLTQNEIDQIDSRNDEAGARLLYLNVQLARDHSDDAHIRSLINELERRFPYSPWLAKALYSAGNMYLLQPDYTQAIAYYNELAAHFPYMCGSQGHRGACSNLSAKSQWRAAWLTYRQGKYSEAAQLFDQELKRYPNTEQFSTALYWRGRLYERNHKDGLAAAYYRTEVRLYPHYYYALMAQQQLQKLGNVRPVAVPALDRINPVIFPDFSAEVPQNNPYVLKAQLLANAGLDGYVASQISKAPNSSEWSAIARAQIFSNSDEAWRAMFALIRAMPYYTQAPLAAIPMPYWKILYPTPYWAQIKAYSTQRGLNPYMIASLIRQESGFRPDAVSGSNAYGLMQLLPSVGRAMARKAGMRHFTTRDLLNPVINIRLGTLYFKQLLDEFNGNADYAFAAYNAGDYRVLDWQKIGTYAGMPEFVESIPFTQTHEYVESIVRNEHMYRLIDRLSTQNAGGGAALGDIHSDEMHAVRK